MLRKGILSFFKRNVNCLFKEKKKYYFINFFLWILFMIYEFYFWNCLYMYIIIRVFGVICVVVCVYGEVFVVLYKVFGNLCCIVIIFF